MTGRRAELEALRRHLSGPERLVTLTGPGGIGKTWLAQRVALELGRASPDGTHVASLGDVGDAGLLPCVVADAMGLQLGASGMDTSDVVRLLAGRRTLVVLDQCEHLLPEVARLVDGLLHGCPGLRVLATSRAPLRLTGERVVLVPPLSLPPADARTDLPTARGFGAVALFVERATAVAPDFRLTVDNIEAVCALCVRLDGNPLALELAAARVGLLAPQAILDRLDDRYRLLTKGPRGTSPQLRSLRASVEASWDLCTDRERTLWARLSVFPGDFDLDAVEQVTPGDGIEVHEVLDLVESLLEKSVLAREADPASVRYSLPETLRAYGAERLGDEARVAWSDRHLDWCERLVQDAADEWFGPRQTTWSRRLRREHSNLRAALDWATRDPTRAPRGLRMIESLESWWVLSGRVTEARHWLAAGLRHGTGHPEQRVDALALAAWLATVQGDVDEAETLLADASGIPDITARSSRRALARARGGVAAARGDLDAADGLLGQTLDLAVGTRTAGAAAEGWFLLGLTRYLAGRADDADEALRRCVALTERAGESQLRASALGLLALGALDRSQASSALALAHEALVSKVEVDDWFSVAFLVEVLAWVALAEKEPVRAAVLLGAAEAMWRRMGLTPALLGPLASDRQQRLAQAREALGGREFLRHAARGAALSSDAVVRYARDDVLPRQPRSRSTATLSSRELAVAELVARGLSNREIAAVLVISVRTVQGHLETILRKLGFSSRAQVAAWVAQRRDETTG